MRPLLTGISGYVGSHLARRLLERGDEVHGVVRPGSSLRYLDAIRDRVVLHTWDDTVESLGRALDPVPDVVVHVASLFIAEHKTADVLPLVDANLRFGAALLEGMRATSCRRIVNTGSAWQNFHSDTYRPVNLYAATKQAFEDVLEYYVDAEGYSAITLRLFDTYGPDDQRPKMYQQLRRSFETGEPLLMSPGEQKIDLLHVDRAVRAYEIAIEKIMQSQSPGHTVYMVSSGKLRTLRAVVKDFEEEFGGPINVKWGGRAYRRREVMEPWQGGRNILEEEQESNP